jgi:hypothetical protein
MRAVFVAVAVAVDAVLSLSLSLLEAVNGRVERRLVTIACLDARLCGRERRAAVSSMLAISARRIEAQGAVDSRQQQEECSKRSSASVRSKFVLWEDVCCHL